MNPNLAIFLKRMVIVTIAGVFVYGIYFAISTYTSFDFEAMGGYLLTGLMALLMGGMMLLIGGITIREMWTAIMNRTENIYLCCPDQQHAGIHIIGKHYHSGGESSEGYDSYHHYYIRLSDGKMFLSKKIDDRDKFERSLADLSAKVKTDLQPNLSKKTEVGYYQDDGEKTIERTMKLPQGMIRIKSFNWLIDYGFTISYSDTNSRVRWRRTV